MGLNSKANSNAARPLPKPGITLAVCYAIIDLGTQQRTFKGQPSGKAPMVQISWELPGQLHTFDETKGPQPLAVWQDYSVTNTEKSKLPKVLKSWGNLKNSIKEITPTMLKKYVGAPCMLTIEHS